MARTYIGRTKEYYKDTESVFTPASWELVGDPSKLEGEVHSLTEEGEALLYRWCDDVSLGYDLRDGKAKGLAAQYSSEEMWNLLTDTKNGYSREVLIDTMKFAPFRTGIFEIVEEWPDGYIMWNIGRENFPHEGYIPLGKPIKDEYEFRVVLDLDSLVALKVKDEDFALRLLAIGIRKGMSKSQYVSLKNKEQ